MGGLDALAAASLQGALLALLVAAFGRLAPRTPARVRAILWWAVSLKLVLAVVAPSALPLPLLAAPAPKVVAPAAPTASAPTAPEAERPASVRAGGPTAEDALRVVWLGGAGALLLVHLGQGRRLRGVLRRAAVVEDGTLLETARSLSAALGLKSLPELRLSDEVGTPLVACAWRPVVLMPRRFALESAPDDVAMALAHELAHVRSRDLAMAVVPTLATLLLWFHPAAWIAARAWTAAREEEGDAVALRVTGGSPAAYGELLVRVAEFGRRPAFAAPTALGATSAYHSLRKRVEAMRTPTLPPSGVLRAVGLAAVSVALLAALPWSVTAQAPKGPLRLAGTWTATRPVLEVTMQYTFKPDGSYLAVLGEMDHQGQYRVEGRRVFLTPGVVAQRDAGTFLKEQAKNPDGWSPSELAAVMRLARPYTMSLSADGKRLAGLGFVARFDPKAKPLF